MTSTTATLATGFTPWPASSNTGPQLTGYLRTNWSRDPYAFGSYSHVAKGARRRDYKRVGAPVGTRLHFAGEAAHPDRNSTVHAALESGRAKAKALLKTGHDRIAIIGAGMAGLAAAHDLSRDGRDVHVIEARDRIGGRINTDHSLGTPCDLGASWLHGADGNPLTKVTHDLSMRKVVTSDSWIARDGGAEVSEDKLPDWLDSINAYDNVAGVDAANLNVSAYLLAWDYEGDQIIFPDGYSRIFDAFTGDYELSLSEAVTDIAYDDAGVQVTTDRRKLSFDAVIITVPLGVLKAGTIAFTPALPARKQTAIDRLGMGTLDKVYLQFNEVFWDREPHAIVTHNTGYPRGQFNDWLNFHALFGQPIIMAFNGGPAALALSGESDETVVGRARDVILSAYGYDS